jgi:hypothetical protein
MKGFIVPSVKVHIAAPQEFHEQNRREKGKLKSRAMRALAAHMHDEAFNTLYEVSDPGIANQCFRILMTDGQWKIGKVK